MSNFSAVRVSDHLGVQAIGNPKSGGSPVCASPPRGEVDGPPACLTQPRGTPSPGFMPTPTCSGLRFSPKSAVQFRWTTTLKQAWRVKFRAGNADYGQ